MSKTKRAPLTVELFFEEIMPRIEEVLDEKFDHKLDVKLEKYRDEVISFKVEVLGEIKDLREEVAVVNHQYERSDKRLTRAENKLKLAPLDF